MAKSAGKLPVEKRNPVEAPERRPLEALRSRIDRLFDEFDSGMFRRSFRDAVAQFEPLWKSEDGLTVPAVDIVEKETAFEITAELPGIDEKDVAVEVANGSVTIRGQKQADTEERTKDYYMSERRFGSFVRTFRIPEGVNEDGIEASFAKGVLSVTMPKTEEAQTKPKTIPVKAG
jgi:HSP20 family protein